MTTSTDPLQIRQYLLIPTNYCWSSKWIIGHVTTVTTGIIKLGLCMYY